MAEINQGMKKMIEENPVALATCNQEGKPHVIAVAYVKIKEDKIIITNNYMNTTINNIKKNQNVSLVVWNNKWEGYQINGTAEYFESDKWYNFIKSIKENKNEPCNGAIVVNVNIIKKIG